MKNLPISKEAFGNFVSAPSTYRYDCNPNVVEITVKRLVNTEHEHLFDESILEFSVNFLGYE